MAVQLSTLQRDRLRHRLRAFGLARGLTSDRAIAAAAELSPKAMSQATGPNGPTLSTLLALCRALDVYSIDELLGISGSAVFGRLDELDALLRHQREAVIDTLS